MIDILTQNALKLTKSERASLFRMLTDYAHILIKIVPHSPLLVYIVSGLPQGNSPIIQAYHSWKTNNQENAGGNG
jgi:hypothetical protein